MGMPKSKAGFGTPVTFAKNNAYPYRQGFGQFQSPEFFHVFDDFNSLVSTNVPTGWAAAIIDTGATVTNLEANLFPSGVLNFTSDGTTEGASIYLPGCIETDDKEMFMEIRVLTADADDTDVQFGLTSRNATTNPEDLWTTASTDVISFGVLDGDATVKMLCDKNNSGSTVETGTIDLQDNTWHTLGLWITGNSADGNMAVRGYVDGNLALTWSTESTIPDDLIMSPFIGARTGGNAAHTVLFDYFRLCAVR